MKVAASLAVMLIALLCSNAGILNSVEAAKQNETDSDLQARIDQAKAGDIITLASGEYEGPLTISKPLTLEAEPGAEVTIANKSEQPAVTVASHDVTLTGFRINDAAMKEQPSILINRSQSFRLANLEIETGSYGIRMADSNQGEIRNTLIEWAGERADAPVKLSEKGNGIDLYQSHDNVLEGNTIIAMHDGIYMENSDRNTVAANRFERLRYGVHCMYTVGTVIRDNAGEYNITGAMIMAVREVEVSSNRFAKQNENVNSQGILLFDAESSVIRDNVTEGNRVGLYVEQSARNTITGNRVIGNYIGLQLLKAEDNQITDNLFVGNVVQAEAKQSVRNELSANYWDAFQGIDTDGDGGSDIRYAISPFFQSVVKAKPAFQLFFQAPSFQFLEQLFQSDKEAWTKDAEPLMAPSGATAVQAAGEDHGLSMAVSIMLLCAAVAILIKTGVKK
ncbi:right-handed parallel beta-helix repeat-containing protein [Paenibacillus soyae]|uniref:Right-handed parallel beta-helix repeat-containing protein n=1 Tax=Paenibacillus soyae TaxID=2969249 RepID=A0A9X2MN42_9BACL|nr:NosD domain-containing protein [Paenibacillus soyae]MCR2802758.1 right-handed parallel beta-helix repeat-containing protein [Paenibacillus soyae]